MRTTLLSLIAAFSFSVAPLAAAPVTLDEVVPPGANFDKAEFRLWISDAGGPLKGVVVLVPGSNGDGRPMADDEFWQAFARRNTLAIVACRFTDKPHDQSFIEEYVNVSKGPCSSGACQPVVSSTTSLRRGSPSA